MNRFHLHSSCGPDFDGKGTIIWENRCANTGILCAKIEKNAIYGVFSYKMVFCMSHFVSKRIRTAQTIRIHNYYVLFYHQGFMTVPKGL